MQRDDESECDKLNSDMRSIHAAYTEVDAKVGAEDFGTSTCNFEEDFLKFKKAPTVAMGYANDSRSANQNGATAAAGFDLRRLDSGCSSSSDFADDLDHIVLKERQRMLLLSRNMLKPVMISAEGSAMVVNSLDGLGCAPASASNTPSSNPLDSVIVKSEPLDHIQVTKPDLTSLDMFPLKSELDSPKGPHGDDLDLDHMQLQDRMKLQAANGNSTSKPSGYFSTSRKAIRSESGDHPLPTEAPDPIKINRMRKRKKTATDSVETALEEDAPGLLKVLVEQGVSVEEMKLYGVADGDDEPIDESFIEDGFADLEDVMTKLFFQRNFLLKLAPIRAANLAKPSYCLSCLFSLVEQARYLQFRDWPAQWGWCRDLQSFIFVFERHNRIVLERPEYGYATYFFELVDSRPIQWQIKRLVTAMKLTGCGRITLIENKPLKVGEDLSEGEAKVLMQYGWTPNTGLGTMLNYCDRVVHDRKSEKERLEWRSKIGKLLMDGYNGGTVVSAIMESATDWNSGEFTEVKTEL
ncbi:unnamed protein product [Linum trigynum]|uniref:Uncharacterized protein n=1 Tax=Linum trigynum TaxID=586398 RepID=A0AAV2G6Q2_9ROSI